MRLFKYMYYSRKKKFWLMFIKIPGSTRLDLPLKNVYTMVDPTPEIFTNLSMQKVATLNYFQSNTIVVPGKVLIKVNCWWLCQEVFQLVGMNSTQIKTIHCSTPIAR